MLTYVDNELWQCTMSVQQMAAGECCEHVLSYAFVISHMACTQLLLEICSD